MKPLRPYERQDTLKQFLDQDRNVLRFYCHWDDSENMFGDPRELTLHYFLADEIGRASCRERVSSPV